MRSRAEYRRRGWCRLPCHRCATAPCPLCHRRRQSIRSCEPGQVVRIGAIRARIDVTQQQRAAGRAVTNVEFTPAHPVIGGEDQLIVQGNQSRWRRADCAGKNIAHEGCAACRIIGAPQLTPTNAIIRREVHHPADLGEVAWRTTLEACRNILHQCSAISRAIAAPRLGARLNGERAKQNASADGDQLAGVGIALQVNHPHQRGSGFRAIAAPQLPPLRAVAGTEKQRAIQVDEAARGRSWLTGVNIAHQRCPCWRAIGTPQLDAGAIIVGSEQHLCSDYGEVVREGAFRAWANVGEERCACFYAIREPDLAPIRAIIRRKD